MAGEACVVCGNQANRCDLHHVTPEYAGGPTVTTNLVPMCSNKLGSNACHTLTHAAYRSKERKLGRHLTGTEYRGVVDFLTQMMRTA